MPVEFSNLGINLYHAEASQQVQNLFNLGERMNTQLAAGQSQDQGKAEAVEQVQDTSEVAGREVAGDGRGAHSHTLPEKKDEKKPEDPPPPEPPPPDPAGRGSILDIQG